MHEERMDAPLPAPLLVLDEFLHTINAISNKLI